MVKLTINPTSGPTPSQQIIEDANRIVYGSDARGRKLGVRKLNGPLKRQIFKALSAESQEKDRYLGMVIIAACCVSIDGEEISLPRTELQFDALIDRLDDDGSVAIGKILRANFAAKDGEGVDTAGE